MKSAAKGRDEATEIYASLRRAGAGCPSLRKAMDKAIANVAAVYEHKLVMAEQVNAYLEKGWEPVPNVEPVVTNRSAPSPFVKVFLRRTR